MVLMAFVQSGLSMPSSFQAPSECSLKTAWASRRNSHSLHPSIHHRARMLSSGTTVYTVAQVNCLPSCSFLPWSHSRVGIAILPLLFSRGKLGLPLQHRDDRDYRLCVLNRKLVFLSIGRPIPSVPIVPIRSLTLDPQRQA